jgi:hypothetical protein
MLKKPLQFMSQFANKSKSPCAKTTDLPRIDSPEFKLPELEKGAKPNPQLPDGYSHKVVTLAPVPCYPVIEGYNWIVDVGACRSATAHTNDDASEVSYGSPSQLHAARMLGIVSRNTHDGGASISLGSPYSGLYPNRADGAASHNTHDSGESYSSPPTKFLRRNTESSLFDTPPPSYRPRNSNW